MTSDVQRFGAPTKAWETQYEYPQLWGTRRVGPDLARESGIRSDDWQLTHLYNPRLVVADSTMPGYPWLFEGSAAKPGKDAADLLQYVKSLGRARQLAGSGADQFTLAINCACPEDVQKLETEQTATDASASQPRRSKSALAIELRLIQLNLPLMRVAGKRYLPRIVPPAMVLLVAAMELPLRPCFLNQRISLPARFQLLA